jgi:Rrf2 family protein
MRLSTRARYALRMMLDVARHGSGGDPVSLAAVSERTGISRGYLEQLAMALRSARLVRGVSGRHGGYKLTTMPSQITLGRIVEAAIGPVYIVDCLEDPSTCPRAEYCECRVVYALINRRISDVLQEYTIADLIDPRWLSDERLAATRNLTGITDASTNRDWPVIDNDHCPVCIKAKT